MFGFRLTHLIWPQMQVVRLRLCNKLSRGHLGATSLQPWTCASSGSVLCLDPSPRELSGLAKAAESNQCGEQGLPFTLGVLKLGVQFLQPGR